MTDVVSSAAALHTTQPPPAEGAEFWPRAGARLIDTIFLVGLSFAASFVGGLALVVLQVLGLTDAGWVERVQVTSASTYLFSMLANVAFHTIGEATGGTTVGKLLFGLRVVDVSGGRASILACAIRSVATWWDFLFFGAVAAGAMKTSPLRQRYGDRWAKTLVVSKYDAGARPVGAGTAALGIAGAVFAAGTFYAVSVIIIGL